MRYEFLIAGRHLRGRRGVSFPMGIAGVGVALGVGALVIVLSVMNGYSGMIWNRLLAVNAHVTVRKAYSAQVDRYESVLKVLAAHPDVVGVSPFLRAEGFALRRVPEGGTVSSGVMMRGVDSEAMRRTDQMAPYLQVGKVDLGVQEEKGGQQVFGMLIGQVLADKLKVGLGGEFYLGLIPKEVLSGRPPRWRRYVVTGIFQTGYHEFDAGLAFASLEAMRRDLGVGKVITGIHLSLRDPFDAGRVSGEIRQVMLETNPDLFPSAWTYEYGNFYALIQLQKWAFFLILSLIVVVAGFNIISILTMNVVERRREIGILKAMGAPPRRIGRIFTLEGLATGVAGVVVGNALGFGLCWIQQRYTPIRIPGEVYFINALPVEMHVLDFALVSSLALTLCYLFTLLPARDAAALDPVEAIRYE